MTTTPPEQCPYHESARSASSAKPPAADSPDRPARSGEIPGPRPMPVLGWRGNALRFFSNPLRFMMQLRREYGDVVRLAQGGNSTLMFASDSPNPATFFAFGPQCNREITSQVDVFESRVPRGPKSQVYQDLACNVLLSNGAAHDRQRKLLLPTFSRENLKKYHQDMVDYAHRMFADWQGRDVIDVEAEMSSLGLNVASKVFYGVDAMASAENLADMIRDMITTILSPATLFPLNLPGTPYNRLIRKLGKIKDQIEIEIDKKREAGAEGADVLSMMVRAHDQDPEQLTREELVGNAFVMFFAGHDTTSKGLTWTLFLLSQHPEVMADLVDELDEHIDGTPDYEQLYELPVLDRVIKESMRLMPPAVMFARETTRPTTLGGFDLPAGVEVIYSPFITHHDGAVFDQPEKFLPDRWLEIKPPPYEYLPFGAGRRSCLGATFGAMEIRTILPMIVQRFRLGVIPGTKIDIKTNVVMGPKDGLRMTIHPQDREFRSSRAEVTGSIREFVDLQ